MLNIQKYQIKYNISKRTQPINYIVVHYTGQVIVWLEFILSLMKLIINVMLDK